MQQQLEAIYKEHRQGLFTTALSITRQADRAEDAIHDAFARLCRASTRQADDLVAYAYRAVRNAAIDIIRKRTELSVDLSQQDGAFGPSLNRTNAVSFFAYTRQEGMNREDDLVRDESNELIRQAIEALPDAQREVLVMKLYAGLTFDQISKALDEPLSTVASRYRRSLDKLKEDLATLV